MQGGDAIKLVLCGLTMPVSQVEIPALGLTADRTDYSLRSAHWKRAYSTVEVELKLHSVEGETISKIIEALKTDEVMKMADSKVRTSSSGHS